MDEIKNAKLPTTLPKSIVPIKMRTAVPVSKTDSHEHHGPFNFLIMVVSNHALMTLIDIYIYIYIFQLSNKYSHLINWTFISSTFSKLNAWIMSLVNSILLFCPDWWVTLSEIIWSSRNHLCLIITVPWKSFRGVFKTVSWIVFKYFLFKNILK